MEPDSLLDQDDSYGKTGACKVAELGIQLLLRQTFLCLLQESELNGGGGQAAGHCLVLGPVGGHGCPGLQGTGLKGPQQSLWAAPRPLGVAGVGEEEERVSAASALLLAKKEGKEVCSPPACLPHARSPGLPGAVGNLISEIL